MSGLSFGPVPEIGKITIGERNGELCHEKENITRGKKLNRVSSNNVYHEVDAQPSTALVMKMCQRNIAVLMKAPLTSCIIWHIFIVSNPCLCCISLKVEVCPLRYCSLGAIPYAT